MTDAVKVFCAGAVKSAVTPFAHSFQRETGRAIEFTFGPAGALLKEIEAGAPADALVLPRPALDTAAQQGRLLRETLVDLGRVGVGIAVRAGAPLPDVATAAALRAVLERASSLTYGDPAKGDSSGIHFAQVLERLGIARAMSSKTLLAPSGLAVAELVAQGKAELGATQASVILAHDGVALAGPLPANLQHATTYAAAVAATAQCAEPARRFVARLATQQAKAEFARAGFE